MPTIAELEGLLARCRHVISEHDKTVLTFASLPDGAEKRELLAQFEDSLRIARKAEKETREAINREAGEAELKVRAGHELNSSRLGADRAGDLLYRVSLAFAFRQDSSRSCGGPALISDILTAACLKEG